MYDCYGSDQVTNRPINQIKVGLMELTKILFDYITDRPGNNSCPSGIPVWATIQSWKIFKFKA